MVPVLPALKVVLQVDDQIPILSGLVRRDIAHVLPAEWGKELSCMALSGRQTMVDSPLINRCQDVEQEEHLFV